MPEGAEVHTVVEQLKQLVVDKAIGGYDNFDNYTVFDDSRAVGKTITQVCKCGKNIIFCLDDGWLGTHLKITGQLFFLPKDADLPRLCKFRLSFTDKTALFLSDRSKWVRFAFYAEDPRPAMMKAVGVDVLTDAFTLESFNIIKDKKRAIHSVLLDQAVLSGLGNIYVNEALFQADILPSTRACDIGEDQAKRLYFAIKYTMMHAMRHGGTTFSDYRTPDGKKGGYQQYLRAFKRDGKPCSICGKPIARGKNGGRGIFFCPNMAAHPATSATEAAMREKCKSDVVL